MYTSVQDGGREGFRQLGISRCGALDKPALVTANLLVGNGANAAALEITLGQVDIQFERSGWFALTGAACEAKLMASRYGWAGERRSRPGSIWCSRTRSTGVQLPGGGGRDCGAEGAGFAQHRSESGDWRSGRSTFAGRRPAEAGEIGSSSAGRAA
ncbi:hypothetical protein ACLK2E_04000 [Escherichia coli]